MPATVSSKLVGARLQSESKKFTRKNDEGQDRKRSEQLRTAEQEKAEKARNKIEKKRLKSVNEKEKQEVKTRNGTNSPTNVKQDTGDTTTKQTKVTGPQAGPTNPPTARPPSADEKKSRGFFGRTKWQKKKSLDSKIPRTTTTEDGTAPIVTATPKKIEVEKAPKPSMANRPLPPVPYEKEKAEEQKVEANDFIYSTIGPVKEKHTTSGKSEKKLVEAEKQQKSKNPVANRPLPTLPYEKEKVEEQKVEDDLIYSTIGPAKEKVTSKTNDANYSTIGPKKQKIDPHNENETPVATKKVEKKLNNLNKVQAQKQLTANKPPPAQPSEKSDIYPMKDDEGNEVHVKGLRHGIARRRRVFTSSASSSSEDNVAECWCASMTNDESASLQIPKAYNAFSVGSTKGEDNCLFGAVAYFVTGRQDRATVDKLRRLTADELENHAHVYARHSMLVRNADSMGGVAAMVKSLAGADLKDVDCEDPEQCIRAEAKATRTQTRWSSMLQVMALSTVVGHPIQTVIPVDNSYSSDIRQSNVKVKPRSLARADKRYSHRLKHPIIIFWATEGSANNAPGIANSQHRAFLLIKKCPDKPD